MSLDSRVVAIQGVGFNPIVMAIQGLYPVQRPEEEDVFYIFGGATRRAKRKRQEEESLLFSLIL
jgi:hypothetical protein